MWANKAIQESRRLTETQKRRYKDYEEIPGSRYELEFKKRRKMTLEEKI